VLTDVQDFLDCVAEDSVDAGHNVGDGSGHTTPTAQTKSQHPTNPSSQQQSLPQLSSTNLARTTVHDVSVEVVIAPLTHGPDGSLQTADRKLLYSDALQASCIISMWSIEDTQYFTLTFTSATAAEAAASSRPSSRIVNRTSTASHLNRSRGSGSSDSSNSASKVITPTLQPPAFPPRGPPFKSRADISSSASIFQKATQMKDAILNSINMPAYGG
jgi:hypothetical protein